tara:strand:+ start:106 stop:609 length:504 start_codon:yes stop_codon:yes gene_type:complete
MKRLLLLIAIFLTGCSKESEVLSGPFLIQDRIIIYQSSGEPVTGIIEDFYANGKMEIRVTYRDGKMHGSSLSYHPNGQLSFRAEYWENQQVGESEYYEDDGFLKARYLDIDDLQITTFYQKNGQLDSIERIKDNKLHGVYENYDESGKLKEKQCYQNGAKLEMSYCD